MSRRLLAIPILTALLPITASCTGNHASGVVELTVVNSHRLDLEGYDGSVLDLAVGRDGLWGVFEVEPIIRFLPLASGAPPTLFGREGMGPGELRWPRAIVHYPPGDQSGDKLIVFDPGQRAMLAFDADGDHLSTLSRVLDGSGPIRKSIVKLTYGRPFQLSAAPGGLVAAIYPHGVNMPADLRRGQLVWIDASSGERRPLLAFDEVLSANTPSMVLPHLPLWDVCGTELVVYNPDGSELIFLEIGRSTRRIRKIEWPVRQLRHDEIRNYVRHALLVETRGRIGRDDLELALNRAYRETEHLFPQNAPQVAGLMCGEHGSIWLERFDATRSALGHGSRWSRVALGNALAELRLPHGFRPYRFEADRVLGLMEEPSGDRQPFLIEFGPAVTQPSHKEAFQ